ncbi:MAG: transposase, partial [Actinomycetota bacterium]|nr:transposase [Actinomycetota bacterium]
MFATPGKDAETVKAFAEDLTAHGGAPKIQVEEVCCDMSPAFISGITKYLAEQPAEAEAQVTDTTAEAVEVTTSAAVATADPTGQGTGERDETEVELHCPQIIFDRYHVVAKANEAVDEVRRAESKTRPELKRSRYVWLKNEANLTVRQREKLAWLTRPSMQLKTTRAARWRDDFNEFYNKTDPEEAQGHV